eukprot:Nk52_evm31s1737 gene=Nk52_evmTU31s1737
MERGMKWCIVILLCVQLIAVSIFARGFFPHKKAAEGFATSTSNLPPPLWSSSVGKNGRQGEEQQNAIPARFGRLVLVMIDALRYDFVFERESMKFVKKKIQKGEAFPFVSRAHAPTVTMPRIKALLTGGIPGFLDFVLNFASSSLQEDNLVHQLHAAGKKMVFYGDDTWLRLFPGYFDREEGTTSFYVADYTEVDRNVSRHIVPELQRGDWDCMFLHYLGVDHIGHLEGPRSALLPRKLEEMDSVIERIHKYIVDADAKKGSEGRDNDLPTLLVLCGDHGMNEVGNHGGSSEGEVSTTMIFMSSFFKGSSPGKKVDVVNQIDLVPTLAFLFGLPVPRNNLGTFIRPLGKLLKRDEFLQALRVNAYQLLKTLERNQGREEGASDDKSYPRVLFEKASELHRRLLERESGILQEAVEDSYYTVMEEVSSYFTTLFSKYDLFAMGLGIVMMLLCLALSVILCMNPGTTLECAPLFVSVIIGAASYVAFDGFILLFCAVLTPESVICESPLGFIFSERCAIAMAFSGLFYIGLQLYKTWKRQLPTQSSGEGTVIALWQTDTLLIVVCEFLHLFSLLSSSFVEEEHQSYYFFVTTLFIYYFYDTFVAFMSGRDGTVYGKYIAPSKFHLICIGFSLFSLKLLRKWNSTGDKWAGEPDIGRFLMSPGNKSLLISLCVVSLIGYCLGSLVFLKKVIVSCGVSNTLQTREFLLSSAIISLISMFIGIYRLQTLDLSFGFFWDSVTSARIAYVLIFVLWAYSILEYDSGGFREGGKLAIFIVGFIGLQLLIQRIHNMFVVIMTSLQFCAILSWILNYPRPKQLFCSIIAILWVGKFGFFAQGNSNSVATVDISGSYTGLYDYNALVVGILTLLIAYAFPLLAFLFLAYFFIRFFQVQRITSFMRKQEAKQIYTREPSASLDLERAGYVLRLALVVLVLQSSVLSLYSILVTFQRYHLFIWSVFSPKYLYFIVETYVYNLVLLILLFAY